LPDKANHQLRLLDIGLSKYRRNYDCSFTTYD